jgi:hypothetical protein
MCGAINSKSTPFDEFVGGSIFEVDDIISFSPKHSNDSPSLSEEHWDLLGSESENKGTLLFTNMNN